MWYSLWYLLSPVLFAFFRTSENVLTNKKYSPRTRHTSKCDAMVLCEKGAKIPPTRYIYVVESFYKTWCKISDTYLQYHLKFSLASLTDARSVKLGLSLIG